MSWNYGIIHTVLPEGEHQYAIHELYYGDGGCLNSCTVNPVTFTGETVDELKDVFFRVAKAFVSPVHEMTYFDEMENNDTHTRIDALKTALAEEEASQKGAPPAPGLAEVNVAKKLIWAVWEEAWVRFKDPDGGHTTHFEAIAKIKSVAIKGVDTLSLSAAPRSEVSRGELAEYCQNLHPDLTGRQIADMILDNHRVFPRGDGEEKTDASEIAN